MILLTCKIKCNSTARIFCFQWILVWIQTTWCKKQSETGCPVFASVFSLSATWKKIARLLKFVSEVFLLCYNLGRYFYIPFRMIIFDRAIFCETLSARSFLLFCQVSIFIYLCRNMGVFDWYNSTFIKIKRIVYLWIHYCIWQRSFSLKNLL